MPANFSPSAGHLTPERLLEVKLCYTALRWVVLVADLCFIVGLLGFQMSWFVPYFLAYGSEEGFRALGLNVRIFLISCGLLIPAMIGMVRTFLHRPDGPQWLYRGMLPIIVIGNFTLGGLPLMIIIPATIAAYFLKRATETLSSRGVSLR
ncbi:MAG: hypothetical protein C0478_10780 [Planctomyces sp.]|nr:hypothetical protein [Planctomyces sp.]